MTEAPSPTAGASATPAAAVLEQPWATAELTDVRTGEAFSIAELAAAGKTVFVETMAIWCTNCRAQQTDAMTALGRLDRSKVAWVGIDVEASESATALAAYSEQHGFDFQYAVASVDLSRALVAEFGEVVLSPPATPIVVISPSGKVTLTEFGAKSVDRIVALAAEHAT